MKIGFSQVYMRPEAIFPFSVDWQRYLTASVSGLELNSDFFRERFGDNFHITVLVGAEDKIATAYIVGPTKLRKYETVEYTVVLPHYGQISLTKDGLSAAINRLLDSVEVILTSWKIETTEIAKRRDGWVAHIMSNPSIYIKKSS